jgi:hypothetical protein
MRWLAGLVLAATLGVAGCGPNPTELHQALVQSLVGHSEADAVRALGVPSRTADTGGYRFLQWDVQRQVVYPGDWGYGWGPPGYGGVPPVSVDQSCQTMLELQNDRVLTWQMRGNGC